MYNYIFKNRYLIAFIVFLFFVLNQYHGSSIAVFNNIIQPEYTTEYSEPILGKVRAIRSDEWMVTTPNRISSSYGTEAYGRYNYLMRAEKTPNIVNKMFCSYASLANPLTIGTYIFGIEYGQSILWYGTLILTLLMSLEMCLILCRNHKLIAACGALLITFSSYNMWWSQVNWLLGAQASIVCAYHFLKTEKRMHRVLLGCGFAVSFAQFATDLYPAWTVPAGYLYFGFGICIIITNIDEIKKLKPFDWMILLASILFSASIITSFFYYDMEYLSNITATVYPGARVSTGGISDLSDITIQKLFAWIISPYSLNDRISNPSELSSVINFFPLPIILAIWWLWKSKTKDWFVLYLLLFSFASMSYCFIGWPVGLSKLTLMSYSPSFRAIDIFSVSQLYLLLVIVDRMDTTIKLPTISAILLSIFIGLIDGCISSIVFQSEAFSYRYYFLVSIMISIACFLITSQNTLIKRKPNTINLTQITLIILSTFVLIIGIQVNPIQKGFDVILEKPLAKEIQSITLNEPTAKWLDVSETASTQQFLLASGAPTINSTNIMPNVTLWEKLDPEKKYEQIYNRYSHVSVKLVSSETSFELIQPDSIRINLSFDDLNLLDVTYIYSNEYNETLNEKFQLIYNDHCYIYKVARDK